MPPFIIPVALLLGAGGFVAFNVYKKKTAGGAASEIASQVATRGPRGENVFRPELAESLVRMLAGMVYTMPESSNRRFVEIQASPNGAPVQREMSAYGWAESLNSTQSILAMMNLATANREKKFLRAVDPGTEAQYAGPGGLYAVLLYAGTLERKLAPPGAPPGGSAVPPVPMDDQSRVRAELGNDQLADAVLDLLKNGQNPDQMDLVANNLQNDGATFTVALLRKRANQIRASIVPTYEPPKAPSVVTPPYVPPPPPPPGPLPPPPAPVPGPLPPSGVEVTYVVVTQSDPLTLRSGPSTSSTAIGLLPKGSTFRATRTQDGFAFGTSESGKQGWASLSFLREAGGLAMPAAAPPAAGPSGAPYTVVTQSDPLNLRESPSSSGRLIGQLPRGSTFLVDRTESGFAHGTSQSNGMTGWASLSFLKAA